MRTKLIISRTIYILKSKKNTKFKEVDIKKIINKTRIQKEDLYV